MSDRTMRLLEIEVRPLAVPLVDPFVIATGRVEATRSALVSVTLTDGSAEASGLGEGACLPPVTKEDRDDVVAFVGAARSALVGRSFREGEIDALLDDAGLGATPVARAAIEVALRDAMARRAGVPLRVALGGAPGPARLVTDITLPILGAARMADLAEAWARKGFRIFKVKVGKDVDEDVRALEAVARRVEGARFRVDANAGFSARDAIALARALERMGVLVECYEQPCGADDLDGMAEVARAVTPPVIADESVQGEGDVARLFDAGAADGVNLKIVKAGGITRALAIGRAARTRGMEVMVGGMVETRLGMTAAAHLACAVGGDDVLCDLDTAWLLDGDPFEGGYEEDGPFYAMPDLPGLHTRVR